jgi:hypothetical protein
MFNTNEFVLSDIKDINVDELISELEGWRESLLRVFI